MAKMGLNLAVKHVCCRIPELLLVKTVSKI